MGGEEKEKGVGMGGEEKGKGVGMGGEEEGEGAGMGGGEARRGEMMCRLVGKRRSKNSELHKYADGGRLEVLVGDT